MGSPRRRVLTSCGTFMIKSWPKVSLVASWTSKATAATARKHPSHPVATLSSWLEISHGSVPCPHSLGQHSRSHLVLFSHIRSKQLSKIWQAQGGCWHNCTRFEFYSQWDLFCNPGVGCLPPRPQGIVELTFSLDCLACPVSFLGDRATSIHLEGLLRRRVNRRLSPLKQWVFRGGKGHLCPQFRQQVSS